MSESLRVLALGASALLWAAVGVAWAAEAGLLARLRRGWRVCPPLCRALAALAVAAAVAYAGGKGEGAGGEGVSSKEQGVSADGQHSVVTASRTEREDGNLHTYFLLPATYSLTDEDISRGYRLMSVATNEAHSYEMPPDARLVGTWHLTDAYDAVARVFLEGVSSMEEGGSAESSSSVVAGNGTQQGVAHHTCSLLLPPYSFSFPLGGQVVTSLWAHVWGRARPQLGNASNELVAVGAPMFARRGVSRLWTAATPSNTVLLTWQNFFFKGESSKEQVVSAEFSSSSVAVDGTQQDVAHHTYSLLLPPSSLNSAPCSLISAQLELSRDGSFVARSNSVARAYRRVNPDDWDGDGIPNAEDDDPRVAADELRFGPRQSLPSGAHTNNYFWIDLVVRDADALVSFVGDAPSDLPDPSFVARAGETNRVTLLIGKRYTVSCRMPFGIVGKSHPDVAVGADEDGRPTVCRPVRCEIVAASAASPLSAAPRRAATGGRRLRFTPEPVGADVTWNANYCCLEPSAFPSGAPLYNCDGSCGCGGCAVGTYVCRFEGYELSFPDWPCGCSHASPDEPHRPGEKDPEERGAFASASFSASAVVFEDAYEDAPGVSVPWRSTEAEAEFAVGGGPGGASYRLELRDGGRLVRTGGSYLPREGTLGPGEMFRVRVRYGARLASGAVGDVVARATVTEEGGEGPVVSEATLTAVRVEVAPVVLREGFPNRHRMGVREDFLVEFRPIEVMRTVRLASDWLLSKDSPGNGYTCPIRASGNGVEISVEGVSYTPDLRVVEPTGVLCESGFDRCRDGVVAMELEPYVTPLDVSFFGVRIMEVPTAGGAPTGYFANPRFEPIWNHTQARGAGVWHRPGLDNFFFADEPSFGEYCPPPLSAGVIDWAIPLAWGEPTAQEVSDVVGTMGTVYRQVFTLDALGGLRIDKFSQWIHCTAEGAVTHSPGIRGR